MRRALVYGGIAGAIAIAAMVAIIAPDLSNHGSSIFVGYPVVLAALSLIFVGVRRYRDVACGGAIRLVPALLRGLGIAGIAGLVYVLGWEIFTATSGWDFTKDYAAPVLEGMRASGSAPAAIEAETEGLRDMAILFANPLYRLPMTFLEIFPVGLVVAPISAVLLRSPKRMPAKV